MPDDSLRLKVEADYSSVAGLTQKLRESGLSAEEATSALKNLGFTSKEVATAIGSVTAVATPAVSETKALTDAILALTSQLTAVRPAAQNAASSLGSLERAEAMAVARGGAMAAGVGGLGMAMGRVAAATPALASALSAAFPVFAALAFVDIIVNLADKLEEAKRSVSKASIAWDDFAAATLNSADATQVNNLKLEDEIAKLENHPSPNALKLGIAEAREEADKLTKSLEDASAKISELLEKENIGRFKANWLQIESTADIKATFQPMADALHETYAQMDLAQAAHDEKALAAAQKSAADQTDAILKEIARERAALDAEAHPPIAEVSSDVPPEMRQVAPDPAGFQRAQAAQRKVLDGIQLVIQSMQIENEEGKKSVQLIQDKAAAQDAANRAAAAKKATEEAQRALEKSEAEALAIERASGAVMERNAKADLEQLDKERKASGDLALAKLKGAEMVAVAQAKFDEDEAKRQLELHQITIAQETEKLDAAAKLRSGAKLTELEGNRTQVAARPTSTKAEETQQLADLERLDAEIKAEKIRLADELANIAATGAAKEAQARFNTLERNTETELSIDQKRMEQSISMDEERVAHKTLSANKAAEDEMAALNRWYSQSVTLLNAELAQAEKDFGQESDNYQRARRKMETVDQEFEARSRQITLRLDQDWQRTFQKMEQQFNSTFAKVLTGQESWAKASKKLFEDVSETFIQNSLKMIEQEVIAAAQHKALLSGEILGDAKAAAAGAYKAMAGIPIIGPELGAAAAAVTFAAVMAFGSFEKGGIVPQTGPYTLHAGERVLNRRETNSYNTNNNQRTVNNHFHINGSGNAVADIKRAIRMGELG